MARFVAGVSALTLALSLWAGHASANIIYTFSGVTFDDGGTLTGTFTTNDAINSLLDYDITTSAGAGGLGFNYTPGTAGSGPTSLPSIIVLEPADLSHILEVTFNGGLTAAGALIKIGTFDSFEQASAGGRRDIETGEAVVAATPVPEPSTLSIAGLGLLGFFFMRRRGRT